MDVIGPDGVDDHNKDDGMEPDIVYDLRDIVTSEWKTRWYADHRSWKLRRDTLNRNWAPLLEPLADAYVAWRKNPSSGTSSSASSSNGVYDFTIEVIDIYGLSRSALIPRAADSISASIALVQAGFLGSTPHSPSLAISLKTLELFRVIRLHKPAFSVEAFAKTICYFYSVIVFLLYICHTQFKCQAPYRRRYRTALSDAFDIYLNLRRIVDRRVSQFLGRDTPNYRVLNACPPCCYELEGEPELCYRHMWVMDGNNSLKRIKGIGDRQVSDTRSFDESDYFLSSDFVDQYADEVKAHPTPVADDSEDEDNSRDDIEELAGDPTDGDPQSRPSGCTDNWKAAASDEKKKMAKYPLAMVAKALEVLGPQHFIGYDIGCQFQTTVTGSSLGPLFEAKKCRCGLNAFHGYTHNYLCQLHNHPNCIEGMGIEDLETLERVFSSSNCLAPVTRYMTAYRRRVFIDLYFQQWDAEKYQNLATMLHRNYLQALKIIETNTLDIQHVLELRSLDETTIKSFIDDERQYFEGLGKEPEDDLHAIAYVELLEELRTIEAKYEDASSLFRTQTPQDYHFLSPELSYSQGLSETRRADTARRHLSEWQDTILQEVIQLEVRMNIETRWTPTSSEYQKTAQYMVNRKYEKALDNLQRLVIQRLFELHKLNLSQTGYRARTHIAKSLQTRSKAIRNAVKHYNAAAIPLNRPTLDWSKVSHYSFLDEFNLLRDTRSNVHEKPWADPVIRETMRKYQRLQRAKEEITRCNIEIRRLHTSITDEHAFFDRITRSLEDGANPLELEIRDLIQRRRAANLMLLARISQTYSLPGFSGNPEPGTRKGSHPAPLLMTVSVQPQATSSVQQDPVDTLDSDGDDDLDDDVIGDIGGLVDFVTNLT
ncbi:hypothetical protein Hypma_005887 [Hypsizygus marmoreus]|uniref:CxC1-like cysteine cluster associated with KDZ transposases domain-containing protein n=1 Tax=Hypsizygus marmoreus TaxID=39966 RepID=A0A369KAW2_HYPMA|nr:hypothetical protein Hypma_005887 [Hypsizygus marmoreus]